MPSDSNDTFDARATLELKPIKPNDDPTGAADQCLMEETRNRSGGCMVCSAPLVYGDQPQEIMCHYCMQVFSADANCEAGHFVCDACHVQDSLAVIEHICLTTTETDMVALFKHIRTHDSVSVHGPEHHAMVPAVILATHRNLGGDVPDAVIQKAIRRGAAVAGGSCGLAGVCGAATGAGIAFAALLGSTPKDAELRHRVLTLTCSVLDEIAAMRAARCCQRDAYLALRKAAELSSEHLEVQLLAEEPYPCHQTHLNKQCAEDLCPLWQVKD